MNQNANILRWNGRRSKRKERKVEKVFPRYSFVDKSWIWLSRESWKDNQYKLYY